MTRRKDGYQPRAASASQPKMLKCTLALEIVLRDVAPGAVDLSQASATRAMRPVIGTLSEAPVQLDATGDRRRGKRQLSPTSECPCAAEPVAEWLPI